VIYERPKRKRKRKKKANKADAVYTSLDEPQGDKRALHQILQVLPCAGEDDLKDEEVLEQQTQKRRAPPKELHALLKKWENLGKGLGNTSVVTHRLHLKAGAKPVNIKGRRGFVKLYNKIKRSLEEAEKLGVIEESQSEWASPIVPILKPDGEVRVTVDYRELNDLCQKDTFPIPRIDEIVEKLQGAKVYSKLDLTKGYYQVQIHPDDKDKTAFRFGKRLFQFTRMPFGLSAAPQTFQRLMNKVLAHLPFAECYLDDIIIFSADLAEHIQHLEAVFKALQEANLRINLAKCEFGVSDVEYLGFRINQNKRSPTDGKIDLIGNFPRPTNKRNSARSLEWRVSIVTWSPASPS
jgi:hypothetical protein